jgi:dephospho-CoA kinase
MLMLIIGLTGGIASGKSTVSLMFEDAGAPVICLDRLAHEAVEPGAPAIDDIRKAFGDEVIDEAGGLDRKAMAGVVFNDDAKRKQLESIIHPRVREEKDRRVRELEKQGQFMVIVDVPLLYEVQWDKSCDLVVVVYASRDVQEQRLIERDGLSEHEAKLRLNAQMSIEEKKNRADFIIDNTGGMQETRDRFDELLTRLNEKAEAHARRN